MVNCGGSVLVLSPQLASFRKAMSKKFSAPTKICPMCKEEKPVSAFTLRNTKWRTGPVSRCKACCALVSRATCKKVTSDPCRVIKRRTAAKKWREQNPERVRATAQKGRTQHREERNAAYRKWRKENPDRAREYEATKQKRWAKELRDRRMTPEAKAKRAEYWKNNPGMKSAICAARRVRQKNAYPAWADRKAIAEIYRKAELLTERTGTEHHVDHIDPIHHRLVCGLHVAANLQILTADENRRKSNRFEPIQEVYAVTA